MSERFANGVTDSGRRFELQENGGLSFADYSVQEGRMIVPHVETDPQLRGQGSAGRLMAGVMDAARRRGLKIVPLCPYADAYMRRHPDTADLRA